MVRSVLKVGETYGGLEILSLGQNPEYRCGKSYKVFVRCIHCKAEVYRDRSNVYSSALKSCGCRKNVVAVKPGGKYQ